MTDSTITVTLPLAQWQTLLEAHGGIAAGHPALVAAWKALTDAVYGPKEPGA